MGHYDLGQNNLWVEISARHEFISRGKLSSQVPWDTYLKWWLTEVTNHNFWIVCHIYFWKQHKISLNLVGIWLYCPGGYDAPEVCLWTISRIYIVWAQIVQTQNRGYMWIILSRSARIFSIRCDTKITCFIDNLQYKGTFSTMHLIFMVGRGSIAMDQSLCLFLRTKYKKVFSKSDACFYIRLIQGIQKYGIELNPMSHFWAPAK